MISPFLHLVTQALYLRASHLRAQEGLEGHHDGIPGVVVVLSASSSAAASISTPSAEARRWPVMGPVKVVGSPAAVGAAVATSSVVIVPVGPVLGEKNPR